MDEIYEDLADNLHAIVNSDGSVEEKREAFLAGLEENDATDDWNELLSWFKQLESAEAPAA